MFNNKDFQLKQRKLLSNNYVVQVKQTAPTNMQEYKNYDKKHSYKKLLFMVRNPIFSKYGDPVSYCRWNVASLCCSEDGRYPESDVSIFCSHTCLDIIRNTE